MRRPARTIAFMYVAALGTMMAAPAQPAPPGKMVDLGGHRLHVNCTGSGPFTVVVENGLGDFSFGWILVQQRVEKFSRICTYDRAGYAWSDPGPMPRTFAQLNLELHDALQKLGEHHSLILVGHSFGGGVVRQFAQTYPADVAGMVLVEAVPEDQRIPMGPGKAARIRDFAKGVSIPAPRENLLPSDRRSLPAASNPQGTIEPPFDRLPRQQQLLQLWAEQLPALEDAENSQKEWSTEYMQQMYERPQDGSLGAMPLRVLTRAEGGYGNDLNVPAEELEAERLSLQSRLALLSSNGKQVIVHSGHNMHLEAPDAVADAIQNVLASCRRLANDPRSAPHPIHSSPSRPK
jgi:pimeloyl-ACP methyl ester carboxylesterase